jgi:single-stranded-DNA-specific exonuclease
MEFPLPAIEYAEQNNFTLIIALDCGIKSVELVDVASLKGIDFIICDHHLPTTQYRNAVAVLDPKQENCEYPYLGIKWMRNWIQIHAGLRAKASA